MLKVGEIHCSIKVDETCRPSTTPLSAKNSYDNKNQLCSSRVLVLPNAAKNSPKVALGKQQGVASNNTYQT